MSLPPSNRSNHHADDSFVREARFGLTIVALLIGVFLVVAWGKYNGWFRSQPMALQATHVNGESSEQLVPFSPFIAVNTDDPRSATPGDFAVSDRTVSDESDPVQVTATQPPRKLEDQVVRPLQATVIPTQLAPPRVAPEATFGEIPLTAMVDDMRDSPESPQHDVVYQGTPNPDSTLGGPADRIRPPVLDPVALTSGFDPIESDGSAPQGVTAQPTLIPTAPAQRNSGFVPQEHQQAGNEVEENGQQKAFPTQRFASLSPNRPVNIGTMPNTLRAGQDDAPLSISKGDPTGDDTVELNDVAKQEPTEATLETPSRKATSIVAQEGDSFWLIAQRVYDDGRYFNALYQANRHHIRSFDEIDTGTRIATPDIMELKQRWPELCPGVAAPPVVTVTRSANRGYYTTAAGDTLFDIAREELGQASRYVELFEINRNQLPAGTGHDDVLPAGLQVRLPRAD